MSDEFYRGSALVRDVGAGGGWIREWLEAKDLDPADWGEVARLISDGALERVTDGEVDAETAVNAAVGVALIAGFAAAESRGVGGPGDGD